MRRNEFKRDLEIDPNELDVQAGLQGELFFKWADLSIEAQEEQDRAKLNLETAEADLFQKAKLDPDSFGITKATDASTSQAVRLQPKYLEASERLIQAKANAARLRAAVGAMEQKKRMIEILVTLHGQQYFAGPSVPRNLADAWKEVRENREQNVHEKQKGKIRKRKRGKIRKRKKGME